MRRDDKQNRQRAMRLALATLILPCAAALPAHAADREHALGQLQAMNTPATAEKLVQYAALGDGATVALLIDAGVPAGEPEPARKVTALHNAAAQGHLRLAERLLALGANPNAADWHGVTPLIDAVAGGHRKLVELLLAHGADVNAVPAQGPTALVCAVRQGDAGLVDLLLRAHARPDLADAFGTTPADAARLAGRPALAVKFGTALAAKEQ